jgi:heme A synthase
MKIAGFLLFIFLPFQALLGMYQQTTALIAITLIKQMVVSKIGKGEQPFFISN